MVRWTANKGDPRLPASRSRLSIPVKPDATRPRIGARSKAAYPLAGRSVDHQAPGTRGRARPGGATLRRVGATQGVEVRHYHLSQVWLGLS
jgi:hypothetical protein